MVFFGRWVEVIVRWGWVVSVPGCGAGFRGRVVLGIVPGVRAGGRGGRIVRSCGAGGRGPGRRMAGGAPVSALMP